MISRMMRDGKDGLTMDSNVASPEMYKKIARRLAFKDELPGLEPSAQQRSRWQTPAACTKGEK